MNKLHKTTQDKSQIDLQARLLRLSKRQQEVLLGLLQGYSDQEIGKTLGGLSLSAVRKHVQKVAEGLGLRHPGERRRSHRSDLQQLPITPEELQMIIAGRFLPSSHVVSTRPFMPITGAMPPDSPLYVEREADKLCKQALMADHQRAGFLPFLKVKGCQGVGKSSLLVRLRYFLEKDLSQVAALVDLNSADFTSNAFTNTDELLKQFTQVVAQKFKEAAINLKLDNFELPEIGDQWSQGLSSGMKCTDYLYNLFNSPILKNHQKVLLIDGLDTILGQDSMRISFLGLLRGWNEQMMKFSTYLYPVWSSIIVSYSIEPSYGNDPRYQNNSPMQNVGIPIKLEKFNPKHIIQLIELYELNPKTVSPELIYNITDGSPDLVNWILWEVKQNNLMFQSHEDKMKVIQGPFENFLIEKIKPIENDNSLIDCFLKILNDKECNDKDAEFQLEQLGLIRRKYFKITPKCEIYKEYYRNYLGVSDE